MPQALINGKQKIRSTDYASFSLFGLLFAFVVGFLIILTSYLLEPVSEYLYRKWELKTYAHLEWSTNTFLHLQRLAHEELGFGTWSKAMETIPTTEVGDLLGCLDITNPNHPVLLHPSKERDSPEEREDTRGIQGTGVSFDATVSVADEVASLASCYEEIRPSTAAGHEPLLDSNGTSGNSSPVFQHQIETHEELLSSGPSTTRSYPKQNTA
jgi:hypothetical protein